MEFEKYQHVKKILDDEVSDILDKPCYVFPKIDGTNASIWLGNDNEIEAGSRNRKLSEEEDNAGFLQYVKRDVRMHKFLNENPNLRLYGEWLVPHTIKQYRDEAWGKFYIFDVLSYENDDENYLSYQEYKPILDVYELEYIPPLRMVENATVEEIMQIAENNTFLMKDGCIGEGVVVKQYGYQNKYGNCVWAKFVRNEFKHKHNIDMKRPVCSDYASVERKIIDKYLTETLILKTKAKIELNAGGWNQKMIPRLMNTVWHDLVTENIWAMIKELKNPTINFKELKRFADRAIKLTLPELF